jgi:pseudouridine-5'-phosphate glycosidase
MNNFIYSSQVKKAINQHSPIVALESTVITHGLPQPKNYEVALAMENEVLKENATPATICLMDGAIRVGIDNNELKTLSQATNSVKVSRKDIAYAVSFGLNGGTTVSGTMTVAHAGGIKVFATGGIGGVHRGNSFDVSSDLPTLARIPMIVVCSGAKAILDIPSTKENLETNGVPILGYKTNELPAFYSIHSGIKVDRQVNNAEEIVSIALNQWELGLSSALLVTVPPPSDLEIPASQVETQIKEALEEAKKNNITGPAITPFLLLKVNEITKGKSMRVNIALLKNNARIAAKIAVALSSAVNS